MLLNLSVTPFPHLKILMVMMLAPPYWWAMKSLGQIYDLISLSANFLVFVPVILKKGKLFM